MLEPLGHAVVCVPWWLRPLTLKQLGYLQRAVMAPLSVWTQPKKRQGKFPQLLPRLHLPPTLCGEGDSASEIKL